MGRDDYPSLLSDAAIDRLHEVRRIAADELAHVAAQGAPGRVNHQLVASLSEHGILAEIFPRSLGGSAEGRVSAMRLCLLREGLAGGSTEAETAFALQGLGSYPILLSGSEEQRRRWIPPVARGEAIAAFALTEARGGSDAASLELVATKVPGGYRLTGAKRWISNAPDADLYTLFARTTPGTGADGVTAFIVPGDTGGLRGEALELMAPHAIGTVELDDAFVPDDHVIGEVDGGFRVAMSTLDLFRPSVGAFAVGMAQAGLDAAVTYARERHAFGKALRELQGVSHPLAEAAARTKAARLLVYEAAAVYDAGRPVTKAAAIAKLYATEAAQFVVDTALQVHGAQGLERGHLLEHLYRDVRAPRIYEGTSEIQREVIARQLFSG